MGEEEHLGGLGKLAENAKAGLCTLIIKVDEEIVGQHGQDGTYFDRLLNRRGEPNIAVTRGNLAVLGGLLSVQAAGVRILYRVAG